MTVKSPGQKERLALAEKALDDIRAVLGGDGGDGGDIILRGVSDDGAEVYVELVGACEGCAVREVTLNGLVKNSLRKYLPDIKRVVQVWPDAG